MDPNARIQRLRSNVAREGAQNGVVVDASLLGQHTDFSDFSEKSGPGDKEPNFSDFVDKP